MTLNLSLPGHEELKPRITVFGVGGAGGNAVNNMIEQELDGTEFVVANTDAQALQQSRASAKIQMGLKVTEGLGAGARATVGAAAAEESIEQIVDHLAGAHMCFITAGMGGGTGTGAAPIIAQAARELGVLTVGVVTKPFQFEGGKRMQQADAGIEALQKVVDTLIIIPNQNLFRLANENTTFTEAFAMADDVLYQGVKGVTDLMVRPGLINLDFADVRAVMDEMGKAMMGTGEADGENRAIQAAEKAIANPLLDEISLEGAKGVLINITGGYDLTLFELDEAANKIREKVDSEANIIVGSTLDTNMEGKMRVSVVATGIDAAVSHADQPLPRRSMAAPLAQPAEAPAPQPVEEAPAVAAVAETEQQPSFAELDVPRAEPTPRPAASQQRQPEPQVAQQAQADDDLPPPAYKPRPSPQLTEAETFVAPRAAAPGTPTPEALARLQAAVARAPGQQTNQSAQQQRPQQAATPTAQEGEKPRFGINSLINRMAGAQAEGAAQQPARTQPQVTAIRQEPEQTEDQDRIEIPAFLRRQAN
ncbi:cell division protein FtsZ [Yoonia sp. R2-816]|uniref:cell division protein FtsZ n=1 Tax=Yoonia sp. R2-816 TaxID=3342638 RepID=UPI00372BC52B